MLHRREPHVQLLLPLAVVAALGAYRLGAKSLWLDEWVSLNIARLHWPAAWHIMVTSEANMMLYYALLHYWVGLGIGEAAIRSLSIIAAVACIVPFYFLGVHLFGARHALLASFLLATNAFFIRYAQEARAYSLVVLLTTTSCLLFVRAIDRPTLGRWVAYVGVSALSVYAQFFAVWLLAAQFLAVMLSPASRRARLRLLVAQAAAMALVVPLAVFAAHGTPMDRLRWVARPTRSTIIAFGRELTGYGGTALAILYFALCILFFLGSWRPNVPPAAPTRLRWSQGFLFAWLAIPVLGTFLFSRLVTPVFVPRFLIVSLAPLPLLAAGGLQMVRPAWLKLGVLAVLFAFAGRGLHTWYARMQNEDWRAAAAYVVAHGMPGDGVVFEPPYIRGPFEYYLLRSDSASVDPLFPSSPWGTSSEEYVPTFSAWWRDHPQALSRVWFVTRGSKSSAAPMDFLTHYCLEGTDGFYFVHVRLYQACVPS